MARPNVKRAGMKAEEFFSSLLFKEKLDYTFVDKWYDYLVEGQKVELKSCQLTHRAYRRIRSKGNYFPDWRIGQFDFTKEEAREKIIKENIWVALVIRHDNQFIMYGFIRGGKLDGKRYLSIHKARGLKPLEFIDWIEEIKRKETK